MRNKYKCNHWFIFYTAFISSASINDLLVDSFLDKVRRAAFTP